MKLFIPPLGTVLTLAQPWTFRVFDESRNESLIDLAGLTEAQEKRWSSVGGSWKLQDIPLGTFTFPVGTRLVVDRIYIRAGSKDFDSVTFRATEYTTKVRTGLKGKKEKSVRFWAKLEDVNAAMEVA